MHRKEVHGRQRKIRSNITTLQIAAEYLLTYGLALLILGTVMAGLFQLHLFSFQQRALPGSCSVFRPMGPYTLEQITLQGVCSNLLPKFVANPGLAYSTFAGGSSGKGKALGTYSFPSYSTAPSLPLGNVNSQGFTITSWVYWIGPTLTHCQGIIASQPTPGSGFALFAYGQNNGACGTLWINGSYVKWPSNYNNGLPNQNRWQFVAATYNQNTGNATVYVDNKVFATVMLSPRDFQSSNATSIGAVVWPSGSVYPINGTLANVQVYNAPLSHDELAAMYREGIGGDPINLRNLVSWWPLNGNANDYSGNGNNGTQVNETYISTYSSP